MLTELFGVAKSSASITSDAIDKAYLLRLKDLTGTETAFEVATTYDTKRLARLDGILENFHYPNTAADGPERLEQVILLANLNADNILDSMSKYWCNIGLSTDDLRTVVDKLKKGFSEQVEFMAIRDPILIVAQKILEGYGEKFNPELHKGACGGILNTEAYALPGTSLDEFIDTLIQMHQWTYDGNAHRIIKGFEDWRAALEVMKKYPRTESSQYLSLGFRTKEDIQSVEADRVYIVLDIFGKYAADYIRGSKERLDELFELTANDDAAGYVDAFEGSFRNYKQMLGMKTKASAAAIKYARQNFNVKTMGDIMKAAAAIDTEHAELYEHKTGSVDEFVAIKNEYTSLTQKVGRDADKPLSMTTFNFLRQYEGDVRFFKYFSIHQSGAVDELSKIMSFEDLDNIRISSSKADIVTKFLTIGYERESLKELRGICNDFWLENFIGKLRHNELPIATIEALVLAKVPGQAAQEYLDHGLFKSGFTYDNIALFHKHGMKAADLQGFIRHVKPSKYMDEKTGFDVRGFITEFRMYLNQDQSAEKNPPKPASK